MNLNVYVPVVDYQLNYFYQMCKSNFDSETNVFVCLSLSSYIEAKRILDDKTIIIFAYQGEGKFNKANYSFLDYKHDADYESIHFSSEDYYKVYDFTKNLISKFDFIVNSDDYRLNKLFLWNGAICFQRAIIRKYAFDEVYYAENGYFTKSIIVDKKGVNADSSILNSYKNGLINKKHLSFLLSYRKSWLCKSKYYILRCSAYNKFLPYEYRAKKKFIKNCLKRDDNRKIYRDKNRLNVLFAMQMFADTQSYFKVKYDQMEVLEYLSGLYERLARRLKKDLFLYVRLHPNDKNKNIVGKYYKNIVWVNEGAIEELLKKMDLVIVNNSTVGVNARSLNVPVIMLGDNFYRDESFVIALNSLQEIDDYILDSENIKKLNRKESFDSFKDFVVENYEVPIR